MATFLGGIGAGLGGAIGSLFGSAPTNTTTTGNQWGVTQGNSSSSGNTSNNSTTTPNLPDWYNRFLQSLMPQYSQLAYTASQPVIGNQQITQYEQGLNTSANNATQTALSQLAKSGALNSGRAASTLTGIQLGKMNNLQQYLASIPQINNQSAMQNGLGLLSAGFGFKAPYGETTTGNSWNNNWANNYSSSTNTSSQKQHNSGSGLLGGLFG